MTSSKFKSGACLILWPMVDNFFHFGDQAAGMLHIQMNYKYKRMIFFFPNRGDGHICN